MSKGLPYVLNNAAIYHDLVTVSQILQESLTYKSTHQKELVLQWAGTVLFL